MSTRTIKKQKPPAVVQQLHSFLVCYEACGGIREALALIRTTIVEEELERGSGAPRGWRPLQLHAVSRGDSKHFGGASPSPCLLCVAVVSFLKRNRSLSRVSLLCIYCSSGLFDEHTILEPKIKRVGDFVLNVSVIQLNAFCVCPSICVFSRKQILFSMIYIDFI